MSVELAVIAIPFCRREMLAFLGSGSGAANPA